MTRLNHSELNLLLLCAIILSLSGCTVNRYYYVAEEPIQLYEFQSLKGAPLLTASIGDTVYATGVKQVGLGGPVPVEYKGYRFYSPLAKAKLLRIAKVDQKKDPTLAAVAYETLLARKAKENQRKQAVNDSIEYWSQQDKIEWYGDVGSYTPILADPHAISKIIDNLPYGSIVKIKRATYSYWQVLLDGGKVGYIQTASIRYFSKSAKPFVNTDYTGRTYHPDGESYLSTTSTSPSTGMSNTPTTRSTIYTGPRGGKYYGNGNKTYVPRSGNSGGRGRR